MKTMTRIAIRNPLQQQRTNGRWTRQHFYAATAAVMTLTCGLLFVTRQWLSSNDAVVAGDFLLHPIFSNATDNTGGHVVVLDSEPFVPSKSKSQAQQHPTQEKFVTYGGEDFDSLVVAQEKEAAVSEKKPDSANDKANADANHHIEMTTTTDITTTAKELGTIVLLAPQRNTGTFWDIDRFCLFIRAVRSIDQFLNNKYGPYPIHVLVSKDWQLDPEGKDGPYTAEDRSLIRMWAPNSTINFVEVNMYSDDAFEPGVTMEQAKEWKEAMPKPFFHGVGYASMCRLWSGRLQQMEFLQKYQFYMRMDDDSLLIDTPSSDPFQKMKDDKLLYVYRRTAYDHWGIKQLWAAANPFIKITGETPFVSGNEYNGMQPYNNFHITRVAFWTTPTWLKIWQAMDRNHVFFQHRAGDANVHAIACMLMKPQASATWSDFPYRHNSNDYSGWAPPEWRRECEADYAKYLPLWQGQKLLAATATTKS